MMSDHGIQSRDHAVVIGASMAGLVTARVLSEHFSEVTVLDRDTLPEQPEARKGVPQGRHLHALLSKGAEMLEGWFPGIGAEFEGDGAGVMDSVGGLRWSWQGYVRGRFDIGQPSIWATRPFIEHHVRRRLRELPNVSVHTDRSVEGLLVDSARAIRGVRVADGHEIDANLVVDCTGRVGRSVSWLSEFGWPAPEVTQVHIDMGYASVRFECTDLFDDGWRACMVKSEGNRRMAFIGEIENGGAILTAVGFHGDHPPTEPEGFTAFIRSLSDPYIARCLERAGEVGPAVPHRMKANQWRRFDKLKQAAPGIVALGDTVVSFDPIYGQGMTSAMLQARALGETLASFSPTDATFGHRYYRKSAKVLTPLWQIAAGGDFDDPRTTGPKPFGTDLSNRYTLRLMRAATTEPAVCEAILDVFGLKAPPTRLFAPRILARALATRARPTQFATASHPAITP
jgi:2-polyprenyl-6-methoxyphenol hydroxylase-like FAD-dependent oxidoreductase